MINCLLKVIYLFAFLLLFGSCSRHVNPPDHCGPLPSASQLKRQEMEYFNLFCYGLNTCTEQEWGYGNMDPAIFNPADLNTDQWAKVAKDAGMKGLMFVARHHDGFCLRPGKYTDYSVKATPLKDGKATSYIDLGKEAGFNRLVLQEYIGHRNPRMDLLRGRTNLLRFAFIIINKKT